MNLKDVLDGLLPDPRDRVEAASRRQGDGAVRRASRALTAAFSSDTVPGRVFLARQNMQTPLSTGRRIAVVGAAGGSGVTSLLVLVVQALQQTRAGGTAVLALADGGGAVAALDWLDGTAFPEVAEQVRPVAVRQVPPITRHAAARQAVGEAAMEAGRTHAVTLLDAGTDTDVALAMQPHLLVLVARNTARGRARQLEMSEQIKTRAPYIPLLPVVRDIPASGRARATLGIDAASEHAGLPYDGHIAGEGVLTLALCAEATRTAIEEIAGEMVVRSL